MDKSFHCRCYPLFGGSAPFIMGVIAVALCICTYLMVVGATSRMSAIRAARNRLPVYLSHLNKNESPVNAVITLVIIHSLVILLTDNGILLLITVFLLSLYNSRKLGIISTSEKTVL
ncbi:hypothetical protein [Clostridium sp.]|uniref:hypothetical protein n=1 Tax=Clostridium sp. TaxID=1506 RepID=UPI002FDE50C0